VARVVAPRRAREPPRAAPEVESRRALTSRDPTANETHPRATITAGADRTVKSGAQRNRESAARICGSRALQRRRAATPTVAIELRRYGDATRRRQHAAGHR
jgi:hypothetical protein